MGTEHQVLVNVATVGRPSARPASFVEWAQDKQRCVLSGINIVRPASADVKLLASSPAIQTVWGALRGKEGGGGVVETENGRNARAAVRWVRMRGRERFMAMDGPES